MKSSKRNYECLVILNTKILMNLGRLIRRLGQTIGAFLTKKNTFSKPKVLIEAGAQGWNSVFFVEFRESLKDYLSNAEISTSSINKNKVYVWQAVNSLKKEKPSHFCFDPRTSSQKPMQALVDTTILLFCLGLWNITPIVILTDGSIRLWRYQAFLLTGSSGVVVTFLDAPSMGGLFPHSRVIGPSYMPISLKRLEWIDEQNLVTKQSELDFNEIFFLGSLYPKRSTTLENLQSELIARGSNVAIVIEEKSINTSIEDYWGKINSHFSLITTTQQQPSPSYQMDRVHIDQMVFRISEALASRKLLFCPNVLGMSRYFLEDVHFVGFESIADAADKIDYMFEHPNLAREIAFRGGERFREVTQGRVFWDEIDRLLDSKLLRT